ncbi:hypothetical protein OIO90_000066 [Microbotryomycetes sp. JL221]|nr:hypothetical protein OIO90_000066 [Microbotryomycetes sp. JL221]
MPGENATNGNSATFEVPKVGLAACVVNPGPDYTIELRRDYPVPTPGRGQLLLKLNCTGICLSDHHGMLGDFGLPMSCQCSGHEGAGVVVAMGEGVEGWKIGDRGGIKPIWDVCHECTYCREGMETHCDKGKPAGVVVDGTYCQYTLSPARYTTRIPDGVPDELAAVTMCSGATIYTAIKNSRVKSGQWLVIPGAGGGVGHQGLMVCRAMGVRVIAIDTGADKQKLCMELGAEKFIDFKTSEDVVKEVFAITGSGAHAVICTGGTAAAYKTAPLFLRKGGWMVGIGLPAAGTAIAGTDPLHLIFHKLTITGSLTGNQSDVAEALDFVARGLVKPVVQVLPFDQFKEGLAKLVAGRIVINYNA